MATAPKSLLCVSWDSALATTRGMLLEKADYAVISAMGRREALDACKAPSADLLILGYSVPLDEKRSIIKSFRKACTAPVLSLLNHHQSKLPEADFGVETGRPADLIQAVRSILE